jgi:hypothetical protein
MSDVEDRGGSQATAVHEKRTVQKKTGLRPAAIEKSNHWNMYSFNYLGCCAQCTPD